jgi:hypothetical protein
MEGFVPILIFFGIWAIAYTKWPINLRAKIWFFSVSLVIVALWKCVFLKFWSYHWLFVTIMLVIYLSAALIYTRRTLTNNPSIEHQ